VASAPRTGTLAGLTTSGELPTPGAVEGYRAGRSLLGLARAPRLGGGPWLLALGAFFVITTRWLDWQGGIAATGGQDVYQYELMSRAAPGLPDGQVGSAYTARFLIHWSVGALAALTGASVELTYRIACLGTMAGFAVTARLCLVRLGVTGWALRLCLALAVLNPYALPYYALVPGYLSDVVFQLGLAVALLGALSRRSWTLVVGVVVAVLARQTIIVVAPILAVWLLVEGRGRPGVRRRLVTALVTAVSPFAVLAGLDQLTRPFTTSFSPQVPEDTVLPLVAELPATAGVLADHLLRVAAPLLLVLSLLLALAVVQLRRRQPFAAEVYLCAVVAAAIVSQPLVIGPTFPGFAGNEPRLSALGFLPLVLCLGAAFRSVRTVVLGRVPAAALLLLVALASLHHIYTAVGPATAAQFVALQGVAAAGAFLVVVLSARWSPETPRPGSLPVVGSAHD